LFSLRIGSGLGIVQNLNMAFGLGSFGIEISVELQAPIYAPGYQARGGGGGGGKGEQRRTYLFMPKTVIFNVGFRGRIYESHFNIPNVAGKILAKRMPLLVKAKGTKDGLN